MSLLLWKIAGELGLLSCEESQVEILIAAAEKTPQTINTKINTKGATKLYLFRDIREVVPPTNPTCTEVAATVGTPANAGDGDVDTFTSFNYNRPGGVSPIIGCDFGSVATRDYAWLRHFRVDNGAGVRISYRVNTDGDTATPTTWTAWSEFEFLFQVDNKQTIQIVTANSRWIEIRGIGESGASGAIDLYEVFDQSEGWGTLESKLQIFDPARSIWKDMPIQPNFAPIDTSLGDFPDTVPVFTEVTPIPHKVTTSDMLRIQDVISLGKINYSLGLIKVDPCKA